MARWRDAKKGKVTEKPKKVAKNIDENIQTSQIICTSPLHRIKAFVTDMFMMMMPIMYITTYIIMDGKDSFQDSETARWLTMLLYGIITVLFWVKKAQTPGFKAYDLHLIDDHTRKPLGYITATARYMMFIISAVSIIGVLLPFFRKDKKTLQDVVMQTSVIKISK